MANPPWHDRNNTIRENFYGSYTKHSRCLTRDDIGKDIIKMYYPVLDTGYKDMSYGGYVYTLVDIEFERDMPCINYSRCHNRTTQMCLKCLHAYYCSQQCFLEHSSEHSKFCDKFKDIKMYPEIIRTMTVRCRSGPESYHLPQTIDNKIHFYGWLSKDDFTRLGGSAIDSMRIFSTNV